MKQKYTPIQNISSINCDTCSAINTDHSEDPEVENFVMLGFVHKQSILMNKLASSINHGNLLGVVCNTNLLVGNILRT